MSNIFLSHSSHDKTVAEQVKARLTQWGYQVFLDFHETDGIPAGRDWKKELYAKLRQCRAVIILCSHASMASRWCFAEVTHADAQGKRVIPIKIDETQIDPILTSVQVIDATAGWDEAYRRLKEGLKDLFDWDSRRPPYPGLPAFQEEDAAIFFGREKEIREGQALLNRLQQFGGPRLTLMLGASGSGKSSLMRAGLLPQLKRDPRWVVINPFRPLKTPLDELATVVEQRFSQIKQAESGVVVDVARIRERIRRESHDTKESVDAFLELLRELREQSGSREATVLLMIDQYEELLTVGANDDGHQFLAFLRGLLDREDNHLMVLATLRSDFLGSFQDHPAIRGMRVEAFPVPQMQMDDFASVIEGPAAIAGLTLGPGLVQAMIGDTKTADALPLLAFTLRELYEGFGKDKCLTLEEYRYKLGGLDGCIARAAEAVLAAKPLSENELSDLRTTLLSMMRLADSEQYAKQPVSWSKLPTAIHDQLDRFVTARLLISGGDQNGRTLEVAHEAIFRVWPRLVGWLDDHKSFLVWQQRINTIIKEWNVNRQNPDLLLRGLPLRQALDWLTKKSEHVSSEERLFVTVSKNRMRRDRTMAGAIAGLVFMVMGLTIWLWGYSFDHALLKMQSLFVSIHRVPDMVAIPAGHFQQGDTHGGGQSNEKPVHVVTVKAFAIGTFEVTFDEYDRFALATGRPLPRDEGWGRDQRPVINVTHNEAKDYANWLSEKTQSRYRLPTESEWEYAARSKGRDDFWAGTSEEKQLADFAVYSKNSQNRTAPVGPNQGRRANASGLYDMSGNVYEWTEDCPHDSYAHAPTDGRAWLEEKCQGYVVRGGFWGNKPMELRTSFRYYFDAEYRHYSLGFRLVQVIEP